MSANDRTLPVFEPPVWFTTGVMAKLDELRKKFRSGEAVARGADFPHASLALAA